MTPRLPKQAVCRSSPLEVVPSANAAQKLFSGLMIFLFGPALRYMLKMK
jgi:hypothetical protein